MRLANTAAAVALIVVSGCQRENDRTTIRPADVAPSPPSEISETIGRQPIVTTTGSPPPTENVRLEFEPVDVTDAEVRVRELLPAKSTAFLVRNLGSRPYAVEFQHDGAAVARTAGTIPPGSEVIVQINLTGTAYRIVVPGEPQGTTFRLYRPR